MTPYAAKSAGAEDGDPHYFVDRVSDMKIGNSDRLWKVHFQPRNQDGKSKGGGTKGGVDGVASYLWSWEPLESFTTSAGITEQLVLFEEVRTGLSNTLNDEWEYVPGVPGIVTAEADGFVVYHCKEDETLTDVAAHRNCAPKDVFEQNVMRFGVPHFKMGTRLKAHTQLRLPMTLDAAQAAVRHGLAVNAASSDTGGGGAALGAVAGGVSSELFPLPTTIVHSANTTIITTDIPAPHCKEDETLKDAIAQSSYP